MLNRLEKALLTSIRDSEPYFVLDANDEIKSLLRKSLVVKLDSFNKGANYELTKRGRTQFQTTLGKSAKGLLLRVLQNGKIEIFNDLDHRTALRLQSMDLIEQVASKTYAATDAGKEYVL
jgi:hypothetical protein